MNDRATTSSPEVPVTRPARPAWCSHDDLCVAGAHKGDWQRVGATADYVTIDEDGAHFPIVEFRPGHDVGHNHPHVWLTTSSENGVVALTPTEARQLAGALLLMSVQLEQAAQ